MNHSRIFYRIGHKDNSQGLWYDCNGNFTGLIHNVFNFCINKNLQMPFDKELIGWISATDSLDDLFNWFPIQDIIELEKHGYNICVYKAKKVKEYKNHLVICKETSIKTGIIYSNQLNYEPKTNQTTAKR